MKRTQIASMIVGMIVLSGCAPLASIEHAASKINAAIPSPNDVGYIAKNNIRKGCTYGMPKRECTEIKNMQLVNKFVHKINVNKNQALALPVNATNKGHMRKWLDGYEEVQEFATSAYSRKQLKSLEPTMDAIEDKFFPDM